MSPKIPVKGLGRRDGRYTLAHIDDTYGSFTVSPLHLAHSPTFPTICVSLRDASHLYDIGEFLLVPPSCFFLAVVVHLTRTIMHHEGVQFLSLRKTRSFERVKKVG